MQFTSGSRTSRRNIRVYSGVCSWDALVALMKSKDERILGWPWARKTGRSARSFVTPGVSAFGTTGSRLGWHRQKAAARPAQVLRLRRPGSGVFADHDRRLYATLLHLADVRLLRDGGRPVGPLLTLRLKQSATDVQRRGNSGATSMRDSEGTKAAPDLRLAATSTSRRCSNVP